MPLKRLAWKPGIQVEVSPSANPQGFSASNLVRWRFGMPESVLGFMQYAQDRINGVARAMHYWVDLKAGQWLAVGSNTNLYVVESNRQLYDITPAVGFVSGLVSSKLNNAFSLLIWSL